MTCQPQDGRTGPGEGVDPGRSVPTAQSVPSCRTAGPRLPGEASPLTRVVWDPLQRLAPGGGGHAVADGPLLPSGAKFGAEGRALETWGSITSKCAHDCPLCPGARVCHPASGAAGAPRHLPGHGVQGGGMAVAQELKALLSWSQGPGMGLSAVGR